ncbi:MAG: hypothetical protein OEL86_18790 [Sulfuritalea sp.]|nr:hypothetical protein [Sulfuritalea sp.]
MQFVTVAGLLNRPCRVGHRLDHRIAADVYRYLMQYSILQHGGLYVRAADPVIAGVAMPCLAVGRHHLAGQQVVGDSHTGCPGCFFAFQTGQNGLCGVVGDQGGVCIALDDPVGPGAAFACSCVFFSAHHVPDGVPGVGQRGPFQMRQAALGHVDAQLVGELATVLVRGAAL